MKHESGYTDLSMIDALSGITFEIIANNGKWTSGVYPGLLDQQRELDQYNDPRDKLAHAMKRVRIEELEKLNTTFRLLDRTTIAYEMYNAYEQCSRNDLRYMKWAQLLKYQTDPWIAAALTVRSLLMNTLSNSVAFLNSAVSALDDSNQISDGFHTFGELYEHRIANFVCVARHQAQAKDTTNSRPVWRTRLHPDGSVQPGWFLLGIGKKAGEQITYHLPESRWDSCAFAEELERAPEWDGHTSADVLQRLETL